MLTICSLPGVSPVKDELVCPCHYWCKIPNKQDGSQTFPGFFVLFIYYFYYFSHSDAHTLNQLRLFPLFSLPYTYELCFEALRGWIFHPEQTSRKLSDANSGTHSFRKWQQCWCFDGALISSQSCDRTCYWQRQEEKRELIERLLH